jgi:hypothetical protein
MLWFFQKGDHHLRIETTYDAATRAFAVTIYKADGTQHAERFVDEIAFETRLTALERQLLADNWKPRGPSRLSTRSPEPPN